MGGCKANMTMSIGRNAGLKNSILPILHITAATWVAQELVASIGSMLLECVFSFAVCNRLSGVKQGAACFKFFNHFHYAIGDYYE
ncbi:hypothetical protein HYN46_11910 [Aquirhabdus parva]|uniref:Uncharacterized protein n=1 Tax=Aquirhabdus parva TaxID=2283318 RepID=A0A345P872_9GAMM|nr:hypothetical protein HYN46_11910 [Aquirhabdus parva]